jgi:hypothetical protein
MTIPTHSHVPDREERVVAHQPPTDHVASQTAAQVRVSRFTWSPAQWVAALIGLFLVVLGAVALLRVGLDSLTGESATVWMFEHTALMGIVDLVIGLLFLTIAGSSLNSRGGLITLGMLSLAFGLITAIEPGAMAEMIGGDERLGWLYAIIGAVSVIVAFASPTVNVRRSSTTGVTQADEI